VKHRAAWVLASALSLAACGGEDLSQGNGEPIRVFDLQENLLEFVEGELPGVQSDEPVEPYLTLITPKGESVTQAGATEYGVRGRTTTDAWSVAFALEGAGSGYWLMPVGAPDLANDDEHQWEVQLDLAKDIPVGSQKLVAIALDERGEAGSQASLPFCIKPPIPDNLNACRNTVEPPFLVLSLSWDRLVDLDLRVITPEGKQVDSKAPSTAPEDPETGRSDPTAPGTGIMDRDSNHACALDGQNRESLVFQEKPPPGQYLVYASLYDSCGEPSVRFDFSMHLGVEDDEPGTFRVDEAFRKSGMMRADEADWGARIGAYVTSVSIE
jgi:hypothetical protein